MKTKIAVLILVLPLLAVLLSGCAKGLIAASWPGILVDGETAYIAAGPLVYAVDVKTGTENWRFPSKANAAKSYYAAPVMTSDGQLIVSGYDKVLYSLNPQTQGINWEFKESRDRWIGSVLVGNDLIYAPSTDFNLYALNFQGQLQWKFSAGQSIWAAPVTDGTRVYLTALDFMVYALDAQSGEKIWGQELDSSILASPVIGSDGKLYVCAFGGTLYALDGANGGIEWQQKVRGEIWSAPVLADGALYFGTSAGVFYAFDSVNGNEIWNVPVDGPVLGSPLVWGDQILFGSETGSLYFADRATGQNTRQALVGQLYGTPVLAGDLVLVAPVEGDNMMIALDKDGHQAWAFTPGK